MRWLIFPFLIVFVLLFTPVQPAQAGISFSVGFHDELSPYGTWVSYSNYGNCFRPSAYAGWRPYVDGYWEYSSYGPTWYGNEAYAPYVYHYGDWIYTSAYGWIWSPGYDWHPSRVVWSYGDRYIGWRPAFPRGYNYGGNDYDFWVVINRDHFYARSYRPYLLRQTMVRDLWERRVFRTRFDRMDRRVLERVTGRPVRVARLRAEDVRIENRRARMLVNSGEERRIREQIQRVGGSRRDERIIRNTGKNRFDNRSKSFKQVRKQDRANAVRLAKRNNVEKSKRQEFQNRGNYSRMKGNSKLKGRDIAQHSQRHEKFSGVQRASNRGRKAPKVQHAVNRTHKESKLNRVSYSPHHSISRKPSHAQHSRVSANHSVSRKPTHIQRQQVSKQSKVRRNKPRAH